MLLSKLAINRPKEILECRILFMEDSLKKSQIFTNVYRRILHICFCSIIDGFQFSRYRFYFFSLRIIECDRQFIKFFVFSTFCVI